MLPEQIKKILLVRNDNIGDVICTTPCFEATKRHFPQARVAVLVNRTAEGVVRGNPWLDEVYVYDKAKHGRYRNRLIAWWHQAEVLWRIRRECFDLAIGVRSTFSVPQGWLVYASGARLRLGAAPEGGKKRYAFFYNLYARDINKEAHEVERVFSLLRPLGVTFSDEKLWLPIPPESERYAERFLDECNLMKGPPVVVVNYNSRKEEDRWWAEEKYTELIERLLIGGEANVVLTHGPGDAEVVGRILAGLSCPPPVYPPGLKHFAALLARSQVFVSLQGGPTHVAAAVGIPTVAIFGKTSTTVWRPWGDQHRVLKRGDHANLVEVAEVYEAIRELLDRRRQGNLS